MSFTEVLEAVKSLTSVEKQRLRDELTEDFDPQTLLPPGFEIKSGMVAEIGHQVTSDTAGLQLLYELAGIPIPK